MEDLSGLEVLVEESLIVRPPEEGANRFSSGWAPWRYGERVALGATARGGRLQLVNLEPRARTLVLDLVEVPESGGRVKVIAAGRSLGTLPLADPLEIRLPSDLPLGRVLVDLAPSADGVKAPPMDVLAAGVRPVLPSGGIERNGDILIHSGSSWAEFVRDVPGKSQLVGEFVPPKSPEPTQKYRVVVRRAGKVVSTFEWTPGWLDPLRGPRRFQLSTGSGASLVKVTLEARGTGPPAHWRNLRWVLEESGSDNVPGLPSETPPPARPQETPQVVIVYVMDALRADHVGHLGGPAEISPNWDRLAREGFTFLQHRSLAPSTLPSTRTLFTGQPLRFPEEWEVASKPPLLAEWFQHAGYRTGLFSGNTYVSAAYGMERGFDHVAKEVLFGPESPGERGGVNVNAARVQESALAWLDSLDPNERAFLYLHTIHPHNPYAPPPELSRRFAENASSNIDGSTKTLLALQRGDRTSSLEDQARIRGLYAGAFAYNDRELAKLNAALTKRFRKGEVLLILTSDHGEELFDHEGVLHGYTLYEEMLRIPLTLWWPGKIPPGRLAQPTDTLDLHTTLLQLLQDADSPGAARSEGRSLWPVIFGTQTYLPERLHFAAAPRVRGGMFSVLDSRDGRPKSKLVLAARSRIGWGMGQGPGRTWDPAYFFDLGTDPGENQNRVGTGGFQEQWLSRELGAWVHSGEELRSEAQGNDGSQGSELDAETRERLKSLGYLQ